MKQEDCLIPNKALFTHFISYIGYLLINELPFVVSFMLLMGTIEVFQRMHGLVVTPDASTSFGDLMKHLGSWLMMAFVFVSIISLFKRKLLCRFLCYGIVLFFYIVQEFLTVNFGTKITPTILTMVAETNSREASDFFSSFLFSSASLNMYLYLFFVIFSVIVVEFLYSCFVRNKLSNSSVVSKVIGVISIPIFLFCFYSCQIYRPLIVTDISTEALRTELSHVAPQDPITCFIRSIRILHISSKETENAIKTTLNMNCPTVSVDDSVRLILVIGESYIKHHASIYGYPLKTTPRLMRMKEKGELFVFDNVVTPYNSTSRVMKNLLSCNSIGNQENWMDYPYLPALFKKAGYNVFLWDNQRGNDSYAEFSFTLESYMYHPLIQKIAYSRCNKRSYEQDLPLIDNYLNSVSSVDLRSLFAIFHLQGQHIDASSKFPHQAPFMQFSSDDIRRNDEYLTEEKKQRIADYDNATYYNDSVIAYITDIYKEENAVMVYLSDHGDEVYDYRDQYGREHNPHLTDSCAYYEFEIPFVVWCSEKYRNLHPEIIERLSKAVKRPLMSDNVCQLLFTLGNISTMYYHEERDVISPSYKCPPRILQDKIDYDQLMNKHN